MGVGWSESETNSSIGADSQSFKRENQNSAEHFLQIRGRLKYFLSTAAKNPTFNHQTPIPINDVDSFTFA